MNDRTRLLDRLNALDTTHLTSLKHAFMLKKPRFTALDTKKPTHQTHTTTKNKLIHSGLGIKPSDMALPGYLINYGLNTRDRWWQGNPDKRTDNQLSFEKPITLVDGRDVTYIRRAASEQSRKQFFLRINDELINLDLINPELLPFYITNNTLEESKTIVLCEGVAATDALLERGIPAMGTLTATHVPVASELKKLKGLELILWPDNDDIGLQFMAKMTRSLQTVGVANIKMIQWRDGPRRGDAADFSGSKKSLLTLIKNAEAWAPEQLERLTNRPHNVIAPGSPLSLRSAEPRRFARARQTNGA